MLLVDAYDSGQLQDSSLTTIVKDSNVASLTMFSGLIFYLQFALSHVTHPTISLIMHSLPMNK